MELFSNGSLQEFVKSFDSSVALWRVNWGSQGAHSSVCEVF